MALFGLISTSGEEWSLAQQAAAQEEILGVSVVAHPLELVAEAIASSRALNTLEAAAQVGKRLRVAGMRQTWRRVPTTRGDFIYFMSFEDLEGMMDVIISSNVYRRSKEALTDSAGPFIIEGVVEFDSWKGEAFLRADRIWRAVEAKS
jgi:DNA polymerase III alpha subunit